MRDAIFLSHSCSMRAHLLKIGGRKMKSVQARRRTGAGTLLALCLLAAAHASGTSSASTAPHAGAAAVSATWSLPGADLANTRDVSGPINSSTVNQLGVAWTVPITPSGGAGVYATTPVVAGGVMYTQDLASNVEAVNVQTGGVLWVHTYGSPDPGPNGVTVVNGTVYGATATSAFALQAATGAQLWIKKLTRNANEGIDMAPGYDSGTVYVSTVPGNKTIFYAGNGQSILWALNARTGATRWKWDEVPANLWSRRHRKINSGGGQWYPPSFDSQGNPYLGVSNPAPFPGTTMYPWGSSRPGPDLYTDSLVKLNVKTGKLVWYYQLTPHDIYDWDLQNSPILTTANGKRVVIDGGKAGIVIELSAKTGKLLWKRSVGVHNGHDHDNLLAQTDPSKLHLPETVEPGRLGGVETQLASNGTTVFAAVNNLPVTYQGQNGPADETFPVQVSKGSGEFVAIDQNSGRIEWDDKLPSSPYGAATVTNDVVFTTTYDGTLYAFDTQTGQTLWQTRLAAGTAAPVTVVGDTVITASSFPSASGQPPMIVAYRLGATGTLPSATAASSRRRDRLRRAAAG
jgi:outer membrane protein assembly factor BamB